MNDIIKRKNLRIPKYNYSNEGLYFITICIKNRYCILSQIIKGQENITKLKMLPYGKIVENILKRTNDVYNDIRITDYVIMPNHIHFICEIVDKTSLNATNKTKERIPVLISSLKRIINKECKEQIWQRNYYEHIIRNEHEYLKIVEYIQNNPYNWENDKYSN